jgi:hypothetical protein
MQQFSNPHASRANRTFDMLAIMRQEFERPFEDIEDLDGLFADGDTSDERSYITIDNPPIGR